MEKVENVVKEPINPDPNSKVSSGLIIFFWLTNVSNHPRIKQPLRLIKKVPKDNPLCVSIHSPNANRDIAPKNPPIITNNKFMHIAFPHFSCYEQYLKYPSIIY